jgi:hypothetical protein
MGRTRASGLAVRCAAAAGALLLSTWSAGAGVAAQCEGDCNGDDTVVIGELITGVRIALGDGSPADCRAIDVNSDGHVRIDELVRAVQRALDGCDRPLDEAALRAAVSAAVEPILGIIDLGGAAASPHRARLMRGRTAAGRPAGFSGCQIYDCVLDGTFTGTEEVCCLGTQYSLSSTGCAFVDNDGNLVQRAGSFTLNSADAAVCSGAIPTGVSFDATYQQFYFQVIDPDGNSVTAFDEYTETFEAQAGGCTEMQPDQFGFGIRGDGVRTLDGFERVIVADASGAILAAAETLADAVQIPVASRLQDNYCQVAAQIDGTIVSSDFNAQTQFQDQFTAFQVLQVPAANGLFLSYDGTVDTDCVGEVTMRTLEPLLVQSADDCPIGGRLRTEVGGDTATVSYTGGGGLELDFGSDGSVEQRFDRCTELPAEPCMAAPPAGLCSPCSQPQDCSSGLDCYSCSFNCSGQTNRCALPGDLATCADGVF